MSRHLQFAASSRTFRPVLEQCESRNLLSITAQSFDYSASTSTTTVTWRTVATFTADNASDLINNSWDTGQAAFDVVMDMGDGGAANLNNPNPTVIRRTDPNPNRAGSDFTIDWGHQADVVGCMLVPNTDYTAFDVKVGYRYLTPGTYHWNLAILASDGSSKIVSGTATITGPQQSHGSGLDYLPEYTDTTMVNWADLS